MGSRICRAGDGQELERGRHDKVEALLERALVLSADIDDPVTTVSTTNQRRNGKSARCFSS